MSRVREQLHAWIAGRTEREQRLLAVAAVGGALALAGAIVVSIHDDLEALRVRVAGRERALHEVRRLAATLRRTAPASADGAAATPLLTRLEATVGGVVGRVRVAAMTPVAAEGSAPGVALRVGGATLAEVVGLLHACESQVPPLAVTRLALRKHPDDPARFEATLEVAAPGETP